MLYFTLGAWPSPVRKRLRAKGTKMDQQFRIDTIHERRAGIDMIAMPYEEKTVFATPDRRRGGEVVAGERSSLIASSMESPT